MSFFTLKGMNQTPCCDQPANCNACALFEGQLAEPQSVALWNLAELPSRECSFRCPPCGCKADHKIFSKSGKCPECKMDLVQVPLGFSKKIDKSVGPWFEDGKLGMFYPKLIYPIFATGILFCLFLLLSRIKGKSLNIFLTGLILVLSLYGFKHQIYGIQNSLSCDVKAIFTPISFILLIGPLQYFYVKSVLTSSFKWRHQDWLHLLPALGAFFMYLTLLLMPRNVQTHFMLSPYEISFGHTEQCLTVGLGFIYLFYSFFRFQRWKKVYALRNKFITGWMSRFLIGMTVLLSVWTVIIFLNFWLYDFGVATVTYNPLWILLGITLLWFGTEITLNPKFFLVNKQVSLTNGHRLTAKDELADYKVRLENLMNFDKPFLDPNLNLVKLAEMMDINSKHLSMILNNSVGKSFYDFVNFYRIEEAKDLLMDPNTSYLTIEAIGRQAGFKSKSSFYTAFKKLTGMTPKAFMNGKG